VTIESEQEQTFLAARFAVELWLGASRASDGNFQWLSGGALSFSAFGNGQPNDMNGDEDCLAFTRFDAWNDLTCSLQRRFVCEFE